MKTSASKVHTSNLPVKGVVLLAAFAMLAALLSIPKNAALILQYSPAAMVVFLVVGLIGLVALFRGLMIARDLLVSPPGTGSSGRVARLFTHVFGGTIAINLVQWIAFLSSTHPPQ